METVERVARDKSICIRLMLHNWTTTIITRVRHPHLPLYPLCRRERVVARSSVRLSPSYPLRMLQTIAGDKCFNIIVSAVMTVVFGGSECEESLCVILLIRVDGGNERRLTGAGVLARECE